MHPQDAYERIVAWLQRAALDDTLWNETSALIDDACGAKGNLLVVGVDTTRSSGVLFARFLYRGQRDTHGEGVYYRDYYPFDEHLPRLRRLPDSRIVHVTTLFSDEELGTSRTWNEAMRDAHQNGLKVRLDGPDDSRIIWSFADPVDADGWSAARVKTIQRLLPHLRQFVRVRHALVEAQALGLSLGAMLDNDRTGIIQLDRRGRISAANDVALGLLRRADGLIDQGGVLRARVSHDDATLQTLVARAIPTFPVGAASGTMTITRSHAIVPLVVHVSPVQSPDARFRPQRAAALVLVVDAAGRARVDPTVIAAVLGLTPAESDVAVALADGRTIREIAMMTGRGETTIRWHLKQIRGKLGVSRQLDIARLVLSLSRLPRS